MPTLSSVTPLRLRRKSGRRSRGGTGIKKTAKLLGCGTATVYRVKNEAELAAE